jgi:hypothetical protein
LLIPQRTVLILCEGIYQIPLLHPFRRRFHGWICIGLQDWVVLRLLSLDLLIRNAWVTFRSGPLPLFLLIGLDFVIPVEHFI